MKKLFIAIIIIMTALLILSVTKDIIIKTSVEKGVEFVTGLKLSIQSFRAGVLRSVVDIKNIKLFNPPGYKDPMMADVPEIYVDYDLGAIMKGKVHLPKARINLKEFIVVKNELGELNLNSLKVVQAQKEGKRPEEKAPGKAPEIEIDTLELKIGKVIYKDYSQGGVPSIKEFNIDIDERYSNVTNPYSLVSLIVVRSLKNTTIAHMANFDLQGLQGTIGAAQEVVGKVATKAKEAAKATTEVAKKTEEAVEKTAESLTNILKNPFGSDSNK